MGTTTTAPFRRTTARGRTAALVSGATGIAANVLLVLFFALAEPFSGSPNAAGWLGTANDWLMVPQFAALVPVAVALGRRLPASRGGRAPTLAGVAATPGIGLGQLAPGVGPLGLEGPGGGVVAAVGGLFPWLARA